MDQVLLDLQDIVSSVMHWPCSPTGNQARRALESSAVSANSKLLKKENSVVAIIINSCHKL